MGRQRANGGQTGGKQRATNKNDKKYNNDNNKLGDHQRQSILIEKSNCPGNFIAIVEKWLAYKKEKK